MSEITNHSAGRTNLRTTLLATVCGASLFAALCVSRPAAAAEDDADHPVVWVEVGGDFTQLNNSQELYLPPFALVTPRRSFITQLPLYTEKNAPVSWDGYAKISFEPSSTDWVFSASIRYGRNRTNRFQEQRTNQLTGTLGALAFDAYQDVAAQNSESHMVLDFLAGKDVGLGRFGSGGSSVISVGVRYAQFDSRSTVGVHYQPTNQYQPFHLFQASFTAARKFTGIGPSLSWDASADLIGSPQEGEISLDWGLNGAVLFGRRRADIHHQTTHYYEYRIRYPRYITYHTGSSPNRSKQAVVPNVGGFASVSWRLPNAKVSMGYRADIFFGAMDGGINMAKSENRGFYGPFASVSIGIGG
jgi:iron complex outermembrane receptor protein